MNHARQTTAATILAGMLMLTSMSGCRTGALQSTHTRAVALPTEAAGAFAIDVQNASGSVEVWTDPRVKEARVEWFEIGKPIDETGTREWVATDVAVDQGRAVLRVLASEIDGRAVAVRIRIVTPACAGVRVRNSEGPVTLRNVSGAIDVQNGINGKGGASVVVTVDRATNAPITVTTANQDVNVSLPAGSGGAFTIAAPKGRVSMKAGRERVRNAEVTKSRWTGTLNAGEHAITITAEEGNAAVEVR